MGGLGIAGMPWPRIGLAEGPRTWKVGIARAAITPKKNFWMGGFAGRTRPAEGVIHDLWVKALALEDADGRIGLVLTSDILGVPKGIYDKLVPPARQPPWPGPLADHAHGVS